MRKTILLGLTLMACSGRPADNDVADSDLDSALAGLQVFVDPAELPEMPAYPDAAAGRLRVVSSGETDLSRDAEAGAGICSTPAMLILQAAAPGRQEGESWGAIMLLQVPPEGERETLYPVTHVDAGFPAAPASTMALQLTSGSGGIAFQALQGFVQVSTFGSQITGRFQITVREINSEEMVQLSGTFRDVEIHEIDRVDCGAAAMLQG